MEHKHFKCYRCHYHNNFYIPTQIKGRKCKRCNTFNYFIFFRRNKNNNNNRQNRNISPIRNQNRLFQPLMSSKNRIERINNNINNNNNMNNRRQENRILFPQNRINNINLNSSFDSFNDNSNNESDDDFNYDNNIINDYSNFNNNFMNNHFNHFDNQRNINLDKAFNNEIINIPWLKKEKLTKTIINKYGKDCVCSICLENLKDEIHITKCGHIFHYKCIANAINKNINECPNCRSNLRTGEKKKVINEIRYNNYENIFSNNYQFNNRNNIEINNRNNREENVNLERNVELNNNWVFNLFLILLFILIVPNLL